MAHPELSVSAEELRTAFVAADVSHSDRLNYHEVSECVGQWVTGHRPQAIERRAQNGGPRYTRAARTVLTGPLSRSLSRTTDRCHDRPGREFIAAATWHRVNLDHERLHEVR